MTQTPAEKSASQTHVLLREKTTHCGIKFKREKFFRTNIALDAEVASCEKCKKAAMDAAE